jgi:hypothetical protein
MIDAEAFELGMQLLELCDEWNAPESRCITPSWDGGRGENDYYDAQEMAQEECAGHLESFVQSTFGLSIFRKIDKYTIYEFKDRVLVYDNKGKRAVVEDKEFLSKIEKSYDRRRKQADVICSELIYEKV